MSLQRAFAVAEDILTGFQRITRDTVQSSLVLNGQIDHAYVGNSIAEDTMTKYGKDTKRTRGPCWGCGSTEHSFVNRTTITCPNKDKPGVMEKAAKAGKEFNKKLSARKKARGKREQADGGGTGLLSKLSSTQIKALSSDQLRSLVLGANESPSKKPRNDIHAFSLLSLRLTALKKSLEFPCRLRVIFLTSPCQLAMTLKQNFRCPSLMTHAQRAMSDTPAITSLSRNDTQNWSRV
jgi:hypothetical protein